MVDLAELRSLKRILPFVANKLHRGGVRRVGGGEAENEARQRQSASAQHHPIPAQTQCFDQAPRIEWQILQKIRPLAFRWRSRGPRSEEHTSELQSRGHLVCRLLLEKKKK